MITQPHSSPSRPEPLEAAPGGALESLREPPHIPDAMAQLVAIMNGSDDAILRKRLNGQIQSCNRAACRMFGYTSEEMIGQSIALVIPPELREQEGEVLLALARGESVDHFDTIRLTKSGERIPVALTVMPVRDEQGIIIGVSSIARDMRVYKREQALLESDRRKDEFMALLGHELRNPVAPIYNASELLSRLLREQPQALDLSELIRRQVKQLTRLIDDLLDVARISQNRIALECRPLRLAQIIAQGIEAAAPLMQAKHHQLILVPPLCEIYVNADATRLAQCFSNLLTNAAKYTDPGGNIQIECGLEGDVARIEIRDNGSGISADLTEHIFELYVQDDRTRDRAQGGLGIGLPVVKRLIELQGGSIQVHSAGPGQGSAFQIRLLAVPAPDAATSKTTASVIGSKRIFIVDDNVDGARSLALLLQAEGHRVQMANTASEALGQIDAFRPDVALIDIGLPQMDGYELLESLRSRPALRSTRFIALTGYPQEDARDSSHRARFDIYLIKPVDAEMLAHTLQDANARQLPRGHSMQIKEIMSRQVRCCAPEDSLEHAAQLMWNHDCGCLPVCNNSAGGHYAIGAITDRDICMCALFQRKALADLKVGDAMAREVHACRPGDSVEEAKSLMRSAKVRRLLVLDEQGRLQGLISLADLARAAARQEPQVISELEVSDTLAAICAQPRVSQT